ncbi:MAG: hypothetical protein JSS24_08995 [Proteobacteria bacterium]|nr:hypothetical protein [Pseudomonadota bacterium]
MSATSDRGAPDRGPVQMDATQVYREDTFTDRRVGTIRRMTPVSANGEPDAARAVLYVGQAQIMTPMGALPLSFEIDANSLAVAIEKFGPAAEIAVQQTMRELQELRRESASSLVIPEAGGAALANPNDLLGRGGRIRR